MECNDPVYKTPYVAPALDCGPCGEGGGSTKAGGHKMVTSLPTSGEDGMEYFLFDDLDDCGTFKGSYAYNKQGGCWYATGGGGASDGTYKYNETLTKVINGKTNIDLADVPTLNEASIVLGETIVYDEDGTVGVIKKKNANGTYEVRTITTSHGSRQGVRLGSVDHVVDLPADCTDTDGLGWQTPMLGDFAYVREDEGHGDKLAEYVITNVDASCNITWQFSHLLSGDDGHIIVTTLPTSNIKKGVEYVVVDNMNDLNFQASYVWDDTKNKWVRTGDTDKAHLIVASLPTSGRIEGVEYVVVGNLNSPKFEGTYVWNATKNAWIKTSGGEQPHYKVTTLPTSGQVQWAEYVVMTNLNDKNTVTGTYIWDGSMWIKTSGSGTEGHILVEALPTGNNIKKGVEYVLMDDVTDKTTVKGTYVWDTNVSPSGDWVATNSYIVVDRGVSLNGYMVTDETSGTPVGEVIAVMGTVAPTNYLACDGTVYNIVDYPELAAHFIEAFGSANKFGGNGTTTFAVPDLRGEFLRGTGENSHTNPGMATNEGDGAAVGDHQIATVIQNNAYNAKPSTDGTVAPTLIDSGAVHGDAYSVDNGTAPGVQGYVNLSGTRYNSQYGQLLTTRPTNTSILWCIKAKSTYNITDTGNKYAVTAEATYVIENSQMVSPTLAYKSGNTALIDTGKTCFIAPVDGFYAVNFMFPEVPDQPQIYFGAYVYVNGVLLGDNRTQISNKKTESNTTFAMNEDVTVELKKGDKINVCVWVDLVNNTTYTRKGRATMVLLQPATSASVNKAEMMLKPNTWAVGVEQDFGDGVYGIRVTGSLPSNGTALVSISGVTNMLQVGGVWKDSGVLRMVQYSAGSTDLGSLYYKDGAFRWWGTGNTGSQYDFHILYTK